MGEAYAYFKCSATKAQIEAELPTIRELAQVPGGLEIKLDTPQTFAGSITGDPELLDITQEAIGHRDYVMAMRSGDLENEAVANEGTAILNQMYQSPLYQRGEKCFMEVFYKGPDGRYTEVQ